MSSDRITHIDSINETDFQPPILPSANLNQAVIWLAFKQPPIESRFERILNYPHAVANTTSGFESTDPERSELIYVAKKRILLSLMLGYLQAEARPSTSNATLSHIYLMHDGQRVIGDRTSIIAFRANDHEATFQVVPASEWHPEHLDWKESRLIVCGPTAGSGPSREYIEVRIPFAALQSLGVKRRELAPEGTISSPDDQSTNIGRPRKLSQDKITKLCDIVSQQIGFPALRSQFENKLSDLISANYEPEKQLAPSSVKIAVLRYYKLREQIAARPARRKLLEKK